MSNTNEEHKKNKNIKKIGSLLIIAAGISAIWITSHHQKQENPSPQVNTIHTVSLSDFYKAAHDKSFTNATLDPVNLRAIAFKNNTPTMVTTFGSLDNIQNTLEKDNINMNIALREDEDASIFASPSNFIHFIGGVFVTIIYGCVLIFLLKSLIQNRAKGGNSLRNLMNPAGSIDVVKKDKINTLPTLNDIELDPDTIDDVKDLLSTMKNPEDLNALGGRTPRGILLDGPPGNGKTHLAKVIARESERTFIEMSGSNIGFMFMGTGSSKIKACFEKARENAPAIIFIDEIDSIGQNRNARGASGADSERENTLNQMLVEMDGFNDSGDILVIGATNRKDVLDPALTRRFDRNITLKLPSLTQRQNILAIHNKERPLDNSIDLTKIAQQTFGFSGSKLKDLCNEASHFAFKRKSESINQEDFWKARNRIIMGLPKRGYVMKDSDKNTIAVHEAGHGLLSLLMPNGNTLESITILPHGNALGLTISQPTDDQILSSREEMMNTLSMTYGGRIAEELFFGKDKITNGASGDLQSASQLARMMVLKWGFGHHNALIASGDYNNNTEGLHKNLINDDIKAILEEAYTRAESTLKEHKDTLAEIAKALLERETLTKEDVEKIVKATA